MDKAQATRLWEKFREDGDPDVFERLYRAFRLPVLRYCRARIRDEEAAEDICDRVFTYLATARPACTGNFESLVIYYGRLRCNNYRPPRPTESLFDPPARDGSGPTSLEQNELTRRIDEAMAKLPAKEREVIILRLVVGLTISEVSEIICVPTWKVRYAHQRAVKRLKSLMGEL